MKEYTKNKNEYRQDGKLYVEKISRCLCTEKTGERYLLRCRITQRGEWEYFYDSGDNHITKQYGTKPLYLSEKSKKSVLAAVNKLDAHIAEAHGDAYHKTTIDAAKTTFYYKRIGKSTYSFACESIPLQGEKVCLFDGDCTVEKMIHILLYRCSDGTQKSQIPLADNPLYRAAIEHKDTVLTKQVKLYYGIATDSECSWLATFFGKRILPALSEEYDKKYAVDCSGIDYSLLSRSGYRIVHRPYFSMNGSTHQAWELNPHTKKGVDAAKADSDIISFGEFLELFEA